MRVRLQHPIAPPLSTVFLIVPLLLLTSLLAQAQDQAPGPSHLSPSRPSPETLAIFPDPKAPPISGDLWLALVASLREQLSSSVPEMQQLRFAAGTVNREHHTGGPAEPSREAAPETTPSPRIDILRGDRIQPGIEVDRSVTVYLRGECRTTTDGEPPNLSEQWQFGALGWVNLVDGKIAPFIYVDCRRISLMLHNAERARTLEQRDRMMAYAISRVVLHEWFHIATQSPNHAKHGVTKAEFTVNDLIADFPRSPGAVTPGENIRIIPSPPPSLTSNSRILATR